MTERHPDPVTVWRSSDQALLAIAKSLLEAEGIEYFPKGEGLQDWFAYGRLGTGFSPVIGPIELQVAAEDAERASEVLADLRSRQNDA